MLYPAIKFLSVALLAAALPPAGAQKLLTQIPLDSFSGDYAKADVAVNSATNRIYVPLQFVDGSFYSPSYNYFRVLVVNGATNQIVHNLANFPSGSYYQAIAIDPVRNFTYVETGNTPYGYELYDTPFRCAVSVVDGLGEETVKTISLPAGDCGTMVVDSVTGKVYIRAASEVDVIESEETGIVDTFSLPAYTGGFAGEPGTGLAVSPYAKRLYFTYNTGDFVEYLGFFDTSDNQISQEMLIPAYIDDTNNGTNPVVNPMTGHIFGATDSTSKGNLVSVFDSSGHLLATVVPPLTSTEYDAIVGMDVDPKTNLAFAFAETENYKNGAEGTALYVVDGASNTLRSSLAASLPPNSLNIIGGKVAVNPDTSRVYVPYNDPVVNSHFYLNIYSEQ